MYDTLIDECYLLPVMANLMIDKDRAEPLIHTLCLPDCLIHASYLQDINKYYDNRFRKEQLHRIEHTKKYI